MFLRKEYFETFNLEKKSGVFSLGGNTTRIIHGIGTDKHKLFNNCEFLLHNMSYVQWLGKFCYAFHV